MKKDRIPVVKEGYPFIFFSCFVTLILALTGLKLATLVSLVVSGLTLNFFRDPERFVPHVPGSIVAPADGKIIKIESVFDGQFQQRQVQKISIFMNIFNVHVNRMPCNGTIEDIVFKPGRFYSADSNRAALENEYCALQIRHDTHTITCVQMAGLIARRIICWGESGDRLKQGDRFGLIRFGSRVDLYLPVDSNLTVTLGQKVVAGETILGTLPQNQEAA